MDNNNNNLTLNIQINLNNMLIEASLIASFITPNVTCLQELYYISIIFKITSLQAKSHILSIKCSAKEAICIKTCIYIKLVLRI